MNENLYLNSEFPEKKRENNDVIDHEFVRKFALMINMLNNSQSYRDHNLDLQSQIQNDAERELNQVILHPPYQSYSQSSEISQRTQERQTNIQLENSIEFINQNNSSCTLDEINNQNYISLETLKGKMSQHINNEEKNKSRKENSDLKWHDGKVSIKKGKVKVSCNYAFTPTRSSLRVRCIYCKKIYFSVKGFINHRGKCTHFKIFQNNTMESSQMNTNSSTNMFNSFNNIQLDRTEANLQSRYTYNYGISTHQTENSQQNTQINSFEIKRFMNEGLFPIKNIFCNKTQIDEFDSGNIKCNKINFLNDQNGEIDTETSIQNAKNLIRKTIMSYNSDSENNYLNKTNSNKNIDFENFKMHLYATISCLPKELLIKIIRRKNPELLEVYEDEHEVEREKMVEIIFSEITSKKRSNILNETKLNDEKEKIIENIVSNPEVDNIPINSVREDLESDKRIERVGEYDDIFQFNIPTFFRHSFPKNQDIKCYVCRNTGEKSMIMCANCGYTYHKRCQNNTVERINDDWFCDHCMENKNGLILGSKFQVGELVWASYKGVMWPGQIIGKSNQKFELVLFHLEKKLEKSSNEIQTWSEGLCYIDGLASKGAFVRETEFAVMHWQSVYKGLKYYTNSLRSKPRRLPSLNKKARKQGQLKETEDKNQKANCENKYKSPETCVNHPLPLEIREDNETKKIDQPIQGISKSNSEYEDTNFSSEHAKRTEKFVGKNQECNNFQPQTQIDRIICSDIFGNENNLVI